MNHKERNGIIVATELDKITSIMSLTKILEDKKYKEFRDEIKRNFKKPKAKFGSSMLAPPLTNNYAGIGTAFDYLFRFYIEYNNPQTKTSDWVSQSGLEVIIERVKQLGHGIFYKYDQYKPKEFEVEAKKDFSIAIDRYKKYLVDGIFTKELISSSIFLAQLDVICRSGYINSEFGMCNPHDVEDLFKMVSIIESDRFISKETCYLNPTFGTASILVGGADADLIIGDLLVDIKSTITPVVTQKHFNQLIGYYLLSLIGGINNEKDSKPIKRVGIYFSRHGKLWSMPIKALGSEKEFEEFKNWFIKYMRESNK